MEYFVVPTQKVTSFQDFRKSEKEVIGGLCSLANIPLPQESQRDQERRIRREIANSNERRRMQSINAGFQSLKTLIPHTDGEKLSKAAILQQTAEYIFSLEQEKTRLLQQNSQLKRFIQEYSGSSPKRRRAEEKDEGIGSPDVWEDEKVEDLKREMIELRQQLDKERSVRMMLEEQLLPAHISLASTHHPTVIVQTPPPAPSHHVAVVTMGAASVINTSTTSRQNLDTIVQAIQHIEGTQDSQEEERRSAVIVEPVRVWSELAQSDTESDREESNPENAAAQSEAKTLTNRALP
ncbi:transcription factor AP-4 isoform X3 [Callorhinchus milii]|uniref:transcription factor AP-4 isoform X3 n=1 Tax=Callorhinchus milii TaxID=7868 RepID=UPI001C3FA9EC|nr:transcription factor AP-4 isoform X3 [Callorhinchus milii]